jgi:hypothetical protein
MPRPAAIRTQLLCADQFKRYAVMKQLRWITAGILGGALYSWLVTITLARSHAVAWPDWFVALVEEYGRISIFFWNAVVAWLPCLLIATLIGLGFRSVLRAKAVPAAMVGAAVSLLYVVLDSAANGFLRAVFDLHVFVVVGLLPLGVLFTQLYYQSFDTDVSDAGAA